MTFTGRWVGSSISTPKSKDRGPSPVGRQRHYGAVELAGAGEQVNVNDVVEVARDPNEEPGLAQVRFEESFFRTIGYSSLNARQALGAIRGRPGIAPAAELRKLLK